MVGAGAFGGWTALELLRRGADVTVIDAWGPGNARASSGGETRVIRVAYGRRLHYTNMAIRAVQLWREHEARWQRRFLQQTGVLWMFGNQPAAADFHRTSAQALRALGAPVDELTPREASRRYAQIDFDGISSVLLERDAGYLLARRACEHVIDCVVAGGGKYCVGAGAAPAAESPRLTRVEMHHGAEIRADLFVFACGAWLASLFPELLGMHIRATRQEVYYFGTPAGDPLFTEDRLPAWIDFRETQVYGVPGNAHRGFKVADDTPGPVMDPTSSDRDTTAERIRAARGFVAHRFPRLANAPLVGSEVCQYESSPDAEFIIDRHPSAENVWIVGGGSGHGFKMGPAVGELIASLVLADSQPPAQFSLQRLITPPNDGWPEKWI